MIISDYGGRAPDPDAPFGGIVQAWDIDTQTYHDYSTGQDVARPFNDEERSRFAEQIAQIAGDQFRTAIGNGIAQLRAIQSAIWEDQPLAQERREATETFGNAAFSRSQAIAATTPALTVAYMTQVRNEVALAADRDSQIADEVGDLLAWRIRIDTGLDTICDCLIGLARLVSGRLGLD